MLFKVQIPIDKILIFVAAVAVLVIILKLCKASFKLIIKIALNALLGGIVLFLINYIPSITIPITWWSVLLVGIFGIPAVMILIVVYLIK